MSGGRPGGLQEELYAFAHAVRYPPTPDLWPAIAAELEPRPRRSLGRRPVALALAGAAAAALALAFAVPPARTAILRFLGLDGVTIVRVDRLPPLAEPDPGMLGTRSTLAAAQAAVPFPLRLVDGPRPDAVFVGKDVPPAVVLVYGSVEHPRLLLSEFWPCCGQDTVEKEVPRGVAVTETEVDGQRAVWVGGSHLVRTGGRTRLAAPTLIWKEDDVLYRLEAHVGKDEALRLAESLAPASVRRLAAVTAGGGSVAATARMRLARAVHSATLLADGRVLVAGGCTSAGCDGATATTELFDPRRGRFTAGPRMLAARVGPVAVRLRSGQVLLLGGWIGGRPTATAELFDPRANRFLPTAAMHEARGGFTATLLKDGRVLVVGGDDGAGYLSSAEIFDPATNEFAETGSLAQPREAHAAVLLRDGRVAVLGGSTAPGRVTRRVEIWSPRTGRFTAGGKLRVARHKLAAATLRDGRVLVVAGSSAADFRGRYASAELYSPATRSSAPLRSLHGRRFKLLDAVAVLSDGSVLVAGGNRLVERYDPGRRRFGIVGRVGAAFAFATATRLRDGRVLIAGGYDDAIAPTRRAWLYRP